MVPLRAILFIVLGLLAGLMTMTVLIKLWHRRRRKPPASCKSKKAYLNRKFVQNDSYHGLRNEVYFFVYRNVFYGLCFTWFENIQTQNRRPNNMTRKPHSKVTKLKSMFSLILGYLNRVYTPSPSPHSPLPPSKGRREPPRE